MAAEAPTPAVRYTKSVADITKPSEVPAVEEDSVTLPRELEGTSLPRACVLAVPAVYNVKPKSTVGLVPPVEVVAVIAIEVITALAGKITGAVTVEEHCTLELAAATLGI